MVLGKFDKDISSEIIHCGKVIQSVDVSLGYIVQWLLWKFRNFSWYFLSNAEWF